MASSRVRRRIVLHIGTHKAASTTIQYGLEMNRRVLEDAGWLYPSTGYVYKGQHNIVWQLASDKRFEESLGTVNDLREEIESAGLETTILSSEDFENLKYLQIQELRKIFRRFELEVVIYLRRQDQYLQSLWSQLVKTAIEHRSFDAWLEEILYGNRGGPKRGDYLKLLEPWREIFGSSHIIVRPLERSQIGDSVVSDLLQAAGFPEGWSIKKPPNVHQSPSLKTLEIIRQTAITLSDKKSYDRDLHQRLAKHIRQFADKENWNQIPLSLITEKLYSKIMSTYDGSNRALAKQYLKKDELFLEGFTPSEISTFSIQDAGVNEIHRLLCYIVSELISQLNQ